MKGLAKSGPDPEPSRISKWGLLPAHKPVLDLETEYQWDGNEEPRRIVTGFLSKLPHPRRGLFIHGEGGTGKTMLAVALANLYNAAKHEERKVKFSLASEDERLRYFVADLSAGRVLYRDHVSPVEWIRVVNLYRILPGERSESEHHWIANLENASSARLWLIDDLGAGEMTRVVKDATELVLRALYNNSCLCIITSNYTLDRIGEIWGEPIRSRLAEMTVAVELKGGDKRGKQ